MTKNIAKWYKKMKFWNFIGYIVAPFAVVGEGAIIGMQLPVWLHAVVVVAVVLSGYVKYLVKDENNDGIVD